MFNNIGNFFLWNYKILIACWLMIFLVNCTDSHQPKSVIPPEEVKKLADFSDEYAPPITQKSLIKNTAGPEKLPNEQPQLRVGKIQIDDIEPTPPPSAKFQSQLPDNLAQTPYPKADNAIKSAKYPVANNAPITAQANPPSPPAQVNSPTNSINSTNNLLPKPALTIYFAQNATQLDDDDINALKIISQKFKELTKKHPNLIIQIQGHTNNTEGGQSAVKQYRDTLSLNRAVQIHRLLGNLGVPKDAMVLAKFGDSKPKSTISEDNRRVELYFIIN